MTIFLNIKVALRSLHFLFFFLPSSGGTARFEPWPILQEIPVSGMGLLIQTNTALELLDRSYNTKLWQTSTQQARFLSMIA
jgi:cell division septal protein FtsQ